MTRDEFRQQMNSFRKAREQNPQLSYWQWKINNYEEGTNKDGINSDNDKIYIMSDNEQKRYNKKRQQEYEARQRVLNHMYYSANPKASLLFGWGNKNKNYTGSYYLDENIEIGDQSNGIKGVERAPNLERDLNKLYVFGDTTNFQKYDKPLIINGDTISNKYKSYYGNIIPDTIIFSKELKPIIDEYIDNKDIIQYDANRLNKKQFYFADDEKSKTKISLDNVANASGAFKKRDNNYYLHAFDLFDFGKDFDSAYIPFIGSYLQNILQPNDQFPNSGPFLLRQDVPIKFVDTYDYTDKPISGDYFIEDLLLKNQKNKKLIDAYLDSIENYNSGSDKNGIQINEELTQQQKQALENHLFEARRRSGAIIPAFSLEDAASVIPLSNVQDGYDIYSNIINNNYLTAAGILGLAALPRIINKPLKRFIKSAKSKLNSYLLGEKPTVYNLLLSDEQKNVRDNIAESLGAYAEYLNQPDVQGRIINSGAQDYLPSINEFTNKVNNNSLDIKFPYTDNHDAAAVPHDADYGDILFYDDYVVNAAKPYVNNQIFDIPQHEASHLIERNINPEGLETVYNKFLADQSNIKSFDEWFKDGITNNTLPDWILPANAKFNSFSKAGRNEIKQKAKDYYNYISRPTEIHSYLGETTRNAWYNSDMLSDKLDLFPYRNLKELEDSFTNPNAKQILNLYKDKKRLFRNLKNNLWMGIPAIATYNLLQTEEDKSN